MSFKRAGAPSQKESAKRLRRAAPSRGDKKRVPTQKRGNASSHYVGAKKPIADPKMKFREMQLNKLLKQRGPPVKRHIPIESREALDKLNPRLRLHRLNSEIAHCAAKKNLGEAIRVFRQLICPRLAATDVSYAALINAYVRAGETEKARRVFEAMQYCRRSVENEYERSGTLPPGITQGTLWQIPHQPIAHTAIILTTLIKGYSTDGQMEKAWELFYPHFRYTAITRPKKTTKGGELSINSRTLNTFLRGCTRTGDVAAAWLLWSICVNGGAAHELVDAATVTAVVKLLSHALLLEEALAVVADYVKQRKDALPSRRSRDTNGAGEIQEEQGEDEKKEDEKEEDEDEEQVGDETSKSQGDPKLFEEEEASSHRLTADPYLDIAAAAILLNRAEDAASALRMADRILSVSSQEKSSPFLAHRNSEHCKAAGRLWKIVRQEEKVAIKPEHFRRLFYFDCVGSRVALEALDDAATTSELAESVWADSRPRSTAAVSRSSAGSAQGLVSLGWEVIGGTIRRVANNAELEKRIRKKKLRLPKVFTVKKKNFREHNLCLELCSGSGDWVVSQAKKRKAFWLACELRHDRVHDIFLKSVTKNVDNLGILGGDGRYIVDSLLPNQSLNCVYINFPEPPPYFDHPDHLLSNSFFVKLHRVLKPGGLIYVVSDNSDYLQSLARAVQSLTKHFKFTDGREGVILGLPKGFGKGGSYFDRFWENGQKLVRGYLSLRAKEC